MGAARGLELKSRPALFEFAASLKEELNDPEVNVLFHVVNSLNRSFYEGGQPPSAVLNGAEAVRKLAAKLES